MTKGASMISGVRSDVAGIEWPPITTGSAAVLAALVAQLEASQWLPREEIERRQFRQLAALVEHCARHSKQFAGRLERAGLKPGDISDRSGLAKLPLLKRRDVQTGGNEIYCQGLPANHAPTSDINTSGSTGEPVTVRRTAINKLIWLAMTMREHSWHRRDFMKRLCFIRATIKVPSRREDWGPPVSLLFPSGPSLGLPIEADVKRLVELVREFGPDNLMIYPSTLRALAADCRERGIMLPELRHIRTIGETLSQETREEAEATFGAKVEDLYSSNEIGNIATQCPESGLYHVIAEDVLVEVLHENGAPCAVGETGRVTVTSLHNFAMPLVRYDIGDYAEVAGPCPCGRGLPALGRILGRERNLILMPDGTRHWAIGGLIRARDLAPILQWQMIQVEREKIEVRLVTERPLMAGEVDDLQAYMKEKLGYPFEIEFRYFPDRLPLGPNGKFEEFICKVA